MRLSCPSCGAVSSLDGLLQHDAARAAMASAYALSAPLGVALYRYMALFRPAQRALTWDRVATLTNELLPMIEAQQIVRNRKTYFVPRDSWIAGFEQILAQRDKLTLPLKSHGYLLEILAGLAEKAQHAETAKKESIARGETPVGTSAAHKPFTPPPAPVQSNPSARSAGLAAIKDIVNLKGTADENAE